MHFHYLRTVDHYYHTDHHVETCTELTDRTILEFNVIVNPGTRMQAQPQPIEYRHHILQKRYRSLRSCRSAPWRLVQTMRIPDNGICCVVFTLNRCFYPASSVHPVSVLIPYPREILFLWSQTVRQRKPPTENNRRVMGKASETPACRVRVREHNKDEQDRKTRTNTMKQ